MATVSNPVKVSSGSQPSSQTTPPWQVVLFVLLGGMGFLGLLQLASLVNRHAGTYRRYDLYIVAGLLVVGTVSAIYFRRVLRQAWAGTVEMVHSLQWWHWLWLIIFVSGLVFRKRTAAEGVEAPVDSAALFRIVLVGFAGSVLLVKLFLRRVEWLGSLFRGLVGLLLAFDLAALLSTVWSVYAGWTLYKAIEYGVDVCLLATVLVMTRKSYEWKKFMDWTWALYGLMLLNVWFGCVWDPLNALSKGGIYGQQGIGVLGVWLQGVYPNVSSNQIGEYAACITAVALCRLLPLSRQRENVAWYIFLFLAGFITVIFAQTRSALGGFCIAVFFIFLMSRRVLKGAGIVISGLAVALMSGFGDLLWEYVKRGQSASQLDTFSSRMEWWQAALEKFSNYPFTGLGMWAAARYGVLAKIGFTSTATIHSDWVEIIVGTGLWGLAPVLILMLMAWILLLRYIKNPKLSVYDQQIAYEGLAVLCVVTVRMFFMTDLSLHPPLHFFVALGCCEFLRRKLKSRDLERGEFSEQLAT